MTRLAKIVGIVFITLFFIQFGGSLISIPFIENFETQQKVASVMLGSIGYLIVGFGLILIRLFKDENKEE